VTRDAIGIQLGTSFLAHVALFTVLAFGVRWQSLQPLFETPVVYVEMSESAPASVAQPAKAAPRPGTSVSPSTPRALVTALAEGSVSTAPPNAATPVGSSVEGQSYAAGLRAAIDALKDYPALSRARHETGRVKVAFTVQKDGLITNVRVNEASSFNRLNEAALSSVRSLGKFRPVPDSVSIGKWDAIVPLDYVLE
jgi:protein TonB